MEQKSLKLSPLGHTWILDFDGTLVEHNGYLTGEDKFLEGAKEFLNSIPKDDYILIVTAREMQAKEKTLEFLKKNNVRYNNIIFDVPMGERILINDNKPSGLKCAYSISPKRNAGLKNLKIEIDESL